jgi:hypothetical protein
MNPGIRATLMTAAIVSSVRQLSQALAGYRGAVLAGSAWTVRRE